MIETIIGTTLITWFIINYEPFQDLADEYAKKLNNKYKIADMLHIIIGCPKCLGFWLGIAVTFNIFAAIGISITSILINKLTK